MKRILATVLFSMFAVSAFAAPAEYRIDPDHTLVLASWNHFGFSNPSANFGGATGTIRYDADNLAASSVQVTLPLASLDSFVPKLDAHLRSPDFLDAAKYPTITFKSTKVEAVGDQALKVTGDLTAHGVTRPVALDVKLNKIGEQQMLKLPAIGFDASTTLKRSDFGVGQYVPMVSDQLRIRITTEAHAPKGAGAEQ